MQCIPMSTASCITTLIYTMGFECSLLADMGNAPVRAVY